MGSDVVRFEDLPRDTCQWCLREIIYSSIARQWWHAQTGTVHCSRNHVLLEREATPLIGVPGAPVQQGPLLWRRSGPWVQMPRRTADPPRRA